MRTDDPLHASSIGAVDALASVRTLMARLADAGYTTVDPPILQPADIFLDMSGEDIRGRMFLTTDADGTEVCLRPEFTIPVSRLYLASPACGTVAAYSCLGPVFRFRPGQSGEFVQAGIESFGRADREATDAEVLALALEATGLAGAQVRFGDGDLLATLLGALDLKPTWHRRLSRGLAQGKKLEALVAPVDSGTVHDHAGVLAALEGTDRQGARDLVRDLLSIAGIASVGGRTPGEIADRFLEQAALRAQAGLEPEKKAILERFLAISGDPDECARDLRTLASETGLAMGPALDALELRTHFLAAHGLDPALLTFSAAFGRNLDYYTGFVFEARANGTDGGPPIVAGGRYDALLRTLGAAQAIPAVGAAIWIDRLVGPGA